MKINKNLNKHLIPKEDVVENLYSTLESQPKKNYTFVWLSSFLILVLLGSSIYPNLPKPVDELNIPIEPELIYKGLPSDNQLVYSLNSSQPTDTTPMDIEKSLVGDKYSIESLLHYFINSPNESQTSFSMTNLWLVEVVSVIKVEEEKEPILVGYDEYFIPIYTYYNIEVKILENLYGPESSATATIYLSDHYLNNTQFHSYSSAFREDMIDYPKPREGGIYILPIQNNPEDSTEHSLTLLGSGGVLWEIDDEGLVHSHSNIPGNKIYDNKPYTQLLEDIRFYTTDPEFLSLSSPISDLIIDNYGYIGSIKVTDIQSEDFCFDKDSPKYSDCSNTYIYTFSINNKQYTYKSNRYVFDIDEEIYVVIYDEALSSESTIYFMHPLFSIQDKKLSQVLDEYNVDLMEYLGMSVDEFNTHIQTQKNIYQKALEKEKSTNE